MPDVGLVADLDEHIGQAGGGRRGRNTSAERGKLVRLDPAPPSLRIRPSAQQRQQPERLSGDVGHQQRNRRVVDPEPKLLTDDPAANRVDERRIGSEGQPEPRIQTDQHRASQGDIVTLGRLYTSIIPYSSRRAFSGLMRVARRAGTAAPVAAMAASAVMAATVVQGSAGFRPYSRLST